MTHPTAAPPAKCSKSAHTGGTVGRAGAGGGIYTRGPAPHKRIVLVLLSLAFSAGLAGLLSTWISRGQPEAVSQRMFSIFEFLDSHYFPEMGAVIYPNYLAESSDEYKMALVQNYGIHPHEAAIWPPETLVHFAKPRITPHQFQVLFSDPYNNTDGKLRYWLSPAGNSFLILSNGPNGDMDIDLLDAEEILSRADFRTAFVNSIYDPTNGIFSNGDIVIPPGPARSVDHFR